MCLGEGGWKPVQASKNLGEPQYSSQKNYSELSSIWTLKPVPTVMNSHEKVLQIRGPLKVTQNELPNLGETSSMFHNQ